MAEAYGEPGPVHTGGRARPGPRRTLDEPAILAAALRVLDDGGAAALSVRSVAAAVGVAPNALYTYFPTKADLTRALVDDLLGRVEGSPRPSGNWREEVEDLADGLRDVLLAHAGAVPLLLASAFDGPNALALGERLLCVLVRGGLDPNQAARTAYLVTTYVLGVTALDVAELPPGTVRPDDATREQARRQALTDLPSDTHPLTAATVDVIAAYNGTDQFHWGLQRILDGITPGDAHAGHERGSAISHPTDNDVKRTGQATT